MESLFLSFRRRVIVFDDARDMEPMQSTGISSKHTKPYFRVNLSCKTLKKEMLEAAVGGEIRSSVSVEIVSDLTQQIAGATLKVTVK